MTLPNATLEDLSIPMPITQEALQTARRFASQQPTPEKADRVYLNTLAVYAVHNYLQILGIPTNLTAGDSWNPVARLGADLADLEVSNLGRWECRPVPSSQLAAKKSCYIPPEVQDDRLGYIVVEIDEARQQATLWGFIDRVTTSELPLSQLRSMEEWLAYLSDLQAGVKSKSPVILGEWLGGLVSQGWRSLSELLGTEAENLTFAFRQTSPPVKRAKLIDWGMQLGNRSVVVLVAIAQEADGQTNVRIQVHPVPGEKYLPPNLKLTLLSESGAVLQEIPSRTMDNLIQLPNLKATPGERFSIQVALGDLSHQEDFAI